MLRTVSCSMRTHFTKQISLYYPSFFPGFVPESSKLPLSRDNDVPPPKRLLPVLPCSFRVPRHEPLRQLFPRSKHSDQKRAKGQRVSFDTNGAKEANDVVFLWTKDSAQATRRILKSPGGILFASPPTRTEQGPFILREPSTKKTSSLSCPCTFPFRSRTGLALNRISMYPSRSIGPPLFPYFPPLTPFVTSLRGISSFSGFYALWLLLVGFIFFLCSASSSSRSPSFDFSRFLGVCLFVSLALYCHCCLLGPGCLTSTSQFFSGTRGVGTFDWVSLGSTVYLDERSGVFAKSAARAPQGLLLFRILVYNSEILRLQ